MSLDSLLGLRLRSQGDGLAEVELDATGDHHNPIGIVQGGVLCVLADAAMATAFASVVDSNPFNTLELKINFLRRTELGLLAAKAQVVSTTRRVGLVECTVANSAGELVARASCTCLLLG